MPVSGSFSRTPINTSGDLENHIIVFDTAANAPATATPVGKMQGVSFGNYSDNYAKATLILADAAGTETTHNILLLPAGSEQYNFAGRFIKEVEIVAADEPTAPGAMAAAALVASGTSLAGLIDVNFIEA